MAKRGNAEQASKVTKPSQPHSRISRLITACSRCRHKKIKCDHKFPTCTNCEKANEQCVVKDPETGEEISRLSIQSLEIKLRETTEELNRLRMEKMANAFQPQEPNPLTFGKVLFMRDSDMDQKHANDIPFDSINLPERSFAESCIVSFFNSSNVQVPILHRDYYMYTYFKPLYGTVGKDLWSRLLEEHVDHSKYIETPVSVNHVDSKQKCLFFLHIIIAISTSQHQQKFPLTISDHYKNQAFKYVDHVWKEEDKTDRPEISKLEILQSLLLLAQYSLMRPCHPGAWYLVGTCVRLCQDLGLHDEPLYTRSSDTFVIDMRRRLFWSCYSLDRQVSIYFGRQFGINSKQIACPFPSALDDSMISVDMSELSQNSVPITNNPNSKLISFHFFRLRILQGEIYDFVNDVSHRITKSENLSDDKIHQKIHQHDDWKSQKHRELLAWFENSPKGNANQQFNEMVFKLNLNQTIIQIYNISAITPYIIQSSHHQILYEASRQIIWTYVQLTEQQLINFSWVAINNLFIGASVYLSSITGDDQIRNSISLAGLRKDCAGVLTVFDELCNICYEPAKEFSKKFEIHSRSVIEQCQREQEAKRNVQLSSNPISKSVSESNIFSSVGGAVIVPANLVTSPQISTSVYDGQNEPQPFQIEPDYFDELHDNDQLIKQMIGSIDATYEGIFNDIEYDDQDGK
ncbi:putative pyrimidine pathway regulatory protein [Clavispora lusitaniae]|uniref:Pyrimidine pathway regulatory protein n=1 Tax=Clavispora lusitaniae TaxID=36911 RepID=A0ACD0WIM0_CLALS|nr:putative pyrimidine pathway regulatory protein [Clavispora lusitaniae]QFZ33456.1 putative pyrimidine pathway regulatory protein [Clavispora lusitaniae]QFZ39127.1 putative pyrimidine pathway regulatory protein [Clavispora lusitaniae]QFZ44809.1 putative pyrimidine pathway regulatory protein [Clavispora lusitaniae]QFZ50486.1 putative pyrimidine pathway regulatory protein [Clavispora lusitaniae]